MKTVNKLLYWTGVILRNFFFFEKCIAVLKKEVVTFFKSGLQF